MKYDMNYIQYLSGVITEAQYRGEEPINELFGFGGGSALAEIEPLTKKQITTFLQAEVTKIANFVPDEKIEELDRLHKDTMMVCKQIEDIMDRMNEMKNPTPTVIPSGGSSRRMGSGFRLGRVRDRGYSGPNPNAFR